MGGVKKDMEIVGVTGGGGRIYMDPLKGTAKGHQRKCL